MCSNDSPTPLSVRTTVAELEVGDLFLPITRETLAINIPVIEFIRPVEDGISVRGMEDDDAYCVILKGDAVAKLMESRRTVFRALRPGEQRGVRTGYVQQ
jgi:hypothetical protein